MAVFNYSGDGTAGTRRQLIYEQRLWSLNYPYNVDSGAEFYGTAGRMFLSKRGKLEVYADRNRRIEQSRSRRSRRSWRETISKISSMRSALVVVRLRTSIGHLSGHARAPGQYRDTHANNIPSFDPQTEQIIGDDELTVPSSAQYREGGHWAIPIGV